MDEERTLQLAREAIRLGDRRTAQVLLGRALRANPRSETAWLWLCGLVDEPDRQMACLERVLTINPGNEMARQQLKQLQAPAQAPAAVAAAQAVVSVNVYPSPSPAQVQPATRTGWRPLAVLGLFALLGLVASLLWGWSLDGKEG